MNKKLHRKNNRLAVLLCLTVIGAVLASAAEDGQHRSNHLISITEPKFNATMRSNLLHVAIRFSDEADASTFEARLNGNDITKLFTPPGICGSTGGCEKTADIPDNDLVAGDNILTADVGGPNESVGTARTKFEFSPTAFNATVEHMIPAVAVTSLDLAQWTDEAAKDINNYRIVVGPGPGFPQRIYSAGTLACSAGLNSMQVLVLARKTLEPDGNVRVGSQLGQACFGDAASAGNFLKSLPAGDLVIAHTFTGLVQNLNTTVIGGTDYSKGGPLPYNYSIIGVAGAPAGTAYESFDHIHHSSIWNITRLFGSLMLDTGQSYYFVPGDFRRFEIIPNNPVRPGTFTSTVNINNGTLDGTLPADAQGGFFLVVLDRMAGLVQTDAVFATNRSSATESNKAISELARTLTHWGTPDYMVFLTTIGVPFSSPAPNATPLFNIINALGGNGYALQNLSQMVGGKAPVYNFITSGDGAYIDGGYVVENSSAWKLQQSGSSIRGLLARNRRNRLIVKDDSPVLPNVNASAIWPWLEVSFHQPQDWPIWTPGQQLAYDDLTSYSAVSDPIGCGRIEPCQPIRSYYDGGIGGTGSAPPVTTIPYSTLQYHAGRGYSMEEFQTVTSQLGIEAGYLKNVYALYGLFRQVSNEQNDNLAAQLSTVAQNIDSSVRVVETATPVDAMTKASALTGLFSLAPQIGPAFGAASAILNAAAVFTPATPGGVPNGQFAVTLNDLIQKNRTFGTAVANSTDSLFTAIVADWGKLQTIGGGYGAQKAPWYMSPTSKDYPPPRAGLPGIALAAKRQFYRQLLRTKYSLDLWLGISQNRPSEIKNRYYLPDHNSYVCLSRYNEAPTDAWTRYADMPYPNLKDMYVITQTEKKQYIFPYPYRELFFPSQQLLNALFLEPEVDEAGLLAGGAGFDKAGIFRTNGGLLPPREADYQPNGNCK